MEYRVALSLCLLLAVVPLAAGLRCYSCSGEKIDNTGDDCVDADDDKLRKYSEQCPDPPVGEVSKCRQEKIVTEVGNIVNTEIYRGCALQTIDTPDDCNKTTDEPKAITIHTETCYCSTDNCNGQTALGYAVFTSFVCLLLAIIAVS